MSSRQRQERASAAAAKMGTTAPPPCTCCHQHPLDVADPDSNKYHRRHRLPFLKHMMVKQKLFIIQIGVIILLAFSIPIFISKSISIVGTWLTSKQHTRKLLRPPSSSNAIHSPSSQYHQINMNYPGVRSLTNTTLPPHVYAIDNFLTEDECKFLIDNTQYCLQPSTVTGSGKDGSNTRVFSTSRTSWTCRLHREDLPVLMGNVMKLTNKPLEHIEHPQVASYEPTQQFFAHYDAYNEKDENLKMTLEDGGNRIVTILIYLNDVEHGGGTRFHSKSLDLEVRPRQGMAVVFFPATVDGKLDHGPLHAALPAVDKKYVSQIWVRQGKYVGDGLSGNVFKRLSVSEPTTDETASFWSWVWQ